MEGNFSFCNPTRLHFGREALGQLGGELQQYGSKVMLVYGGGSIKRNGVYDAVVREIRRAGKDIVEYAGVNPNPSIDKVREAAALARAESADLILAVGGGSTCDFCKAVAGSAWLEGQDPWTYYFNDWGELNCRWIPVGCVLTLAGTGSEMDSCAVISNPSEKRKKFYYFRNPDFSILNPVYTFSVPKYQMVAGIYDIMSHILEQYLSGNDDNVSDYLAEGLMCSLVASSRKAIVDPEDYEARSNIMWTATWALNGLIACGKPTDWMVHMLGQAVAAYTDATHGHTLSAVSGAYYRFLIDHSQEAVNKFARLATRVWNVDECGKEAKTVALQGLEAMEAWMHELGLAMNITACGAKAEDIENYADACPINEGGYVVLSREDVIRILRDSL